MGITTKSCMIPSAQIIARIAKEILPESTVVWGGPHASIMPDETMSFPNVDFVVRHEGERTIVEFVEMLESGRRDWSSIDGLVWRDESGQVVYNKVRANIPEIDEIPMPCKTADLMPWRYRPDDYGVMFTSRGCPWPCTFCDSRGVWTHDPATAPQRMSSRRWTSSTSRSGSATSTSGMTHSRRTASTR